MERKKGPVVPVQFKWDVEHQSIIGCTYDDEYRGSARFFSFYPSTGEIKPWGGTHPWTEQDRAVTVEWINKHPGDVAEALKKII